MRLVLKNDDPDGQVPTMNFRGKTDFKEVKDHYVKVCEVKVDEKELLKAVKQKKKLHEKIEGQQKFLEKEKMKKQKIKKKTGKKGEKTPLVSDSFGNGDSGY